MTNRALKLCERHSREELLSMQEGVKSDSESYQGASGLHIYNRKALSLWQDIQWALYWKQSPQGNRVIRSGPVQGKYW